MAMSASTSTSKEWSKVVDATIGFHHSTNYGSGFAATQLLEKERARLQAKKDKIEDMSRKAHLPTGSMALSGKSLLQASMYTTESMRNMVEHKPLRYSKEVIMHPKDPLPRGLAGGGFTNWIDMCTAKGCLVPIVASSRPGVTRML